MSVIQQIGCDRGFQRLVSQGEHSTLRCISKSYFIWMSLFFLECEIMNEQIQQQQSMPVVEQLHLNTVDNGGR